MEILSKLFGSLARVKIMRLFLLNRGKGFKAQDVAKRSRVPAALARRELRLLGNTGFIRRSRGETWSFNPSFPYGLEIEELLINSDTLDKKSISEDFKRLGKVKILILSGIFIKNKDSRVDLLVVGDKLRKNKVDEEVKKLEAEIGSELVYAVFDTKEFKYRLSMYDKFVRDILDFPHEVLFGASELSTQPPKQA